MSVTPSTLTPEPSKEGYGFPSPHPCLIRSIVIARQIPRPLVYPLCIKPPLLRSRLSATTNDNLCQHGAPSMYIVPLGPLFPPHNDIILRSVEACSATPPNPALIRYFGLRLGLEASDILSTAILALASTSDWPLWVRKPISHLISPSQALYWTAQGLCHRSRGYISTARPGRRGDRSVPKMSLYKDDQPGMSGSPLHTAKRTSNPIFASLGKSALIIFHPLLTSQALS